MNAQIGKNGNNKYSLHNTSNRNGQHLTDFMIENRLACLNTNYQKREGKLWTYTYANNTKSQIDYVLINKKWKNSAMNCEAYSSFEGVSTDHRIVTAKIRLSTSLMSSSLLLQQCPACLICLILIVFLMGGKWPYSCCFVGCYHQDLFNIAHRILV